MNQLIKIEERDGGFYTTSLNVAEVTGKQHKHVMRTIRQIIEERPELNGSRYGLVEYLDKKGQLRPMYEIDRRGIVTLLFRMTGEKAFQFQEDYMDAWDAMENALKNNNPYKTHTKLEWMEMAIESERRAIENKKRAIESEKREMLLIEDNQTMQPKAEYFDRLVDRNLLTNFRDTTAQLNEKLIPQIRQNELTEFLIKQKIIYRKPNAELRCYEQYKGKWFALKDWTKNGLTGSQLMFTPHGKEATRLLIEEYRNFDGWKEFFCDNE